MNIKRGAVGMTVAAWVLGGCVSAMEYQKKEQQATQLEGEKRALAEQVASLGQEKKALAENLAAAKDENAKLLTTLEAKKGELNQQLASLTKESQMQAQQLREAQQAKDAELARMKSTYDQLLGAMKDEVAAGQVRVVLLQGKLSVNLIEKILFDSGRAEIKPEGRKVLQRIGAVIRRVQEKDIRIEGHTDTVPIGPALQDKYPTNWELSTARATAVARFLQDKAEIEPERLIAAGYGEYRPVAPNDREENRFKNRRPEIVLVPREPIATSVTQPATPPKTPVADPPRP